APWRSFRITMGEYPPERHWRPYYKSRMAKRRPPGECSRWCQQSTPLKARWELVGRPEEGWMFPTGSREGHLNKDTAKDQHKKAIERANTPAKKEKTKEISFFQPYTSGTRPSPNPPIPAETCSRFHQAA